MLSCLIELVNFIILKNLLVEHAFPCGEDDECTQVPVD